MLPAPGAVARAVADELLAVLPRSRNAPRVTILLAGGRTPILAYEIAAAARASRRVAWDRVVLGWSDERCVPPDHADSNHRAACAALVSRVPIPPANVRRIRGEDAPDAAAALYDAELRGRPFDLVLLGMGADGHTASLFPGGRWLDETERWFVASRAPVAPHDRVTITCPALAAARRIVVAVTGAEKSQALVGVRSGDPALPASRVRGAVWYADEAAARGR